MIELRHGMRARATKDLDAVFRAQFDAWLDQLDDAISQPVGGFTLARTEPEEIKQTSTQRVQLVIDYRGRRWAQVPLEVAPVEAPDLYESWREPYQAMVRDTNFEIQTVEDAAALVDEMIAEIDASAGPTEL